MSYRSRKTAFTLAEVLITLVIIGVVAALSLPTLIQKYNNHVIETRLQKFYSVFNQAVQMSLTENGETIENWGFYTKTIWDDEHKPVNLKAINEEKFNKYLAPYMNIVQRKNLLVSGSAYGTNENTFYYLADGSAFSFSLWSSGDLAFYPKDPEKCLKKSTNERQGTCSFNFIISYRNKFIHKSGKGYEPYAYDWTGDKTALYTDPTYGCEISGAYCTMIIYQNGWKIPDDYPRKPGF